jgi:hypothetical protein
MTSNSDVDLDDEFLPKRATAERYKVCIRTIDRWERDTNLGFPKSIVIRKRRYHRLRELIEYERARARAS